MASLSSKSSSNPSLESAKVENIEYKTGASYRGQVENHRRVGRGLFTWPSGARYEGEFADNSRHGFGKQVFEDGTVYEGQYEEDLRHGPGRVTWTNGEAYEGRFFRDRRHGYGTYTWADGSKYSGTFYINKREGYGSLTHPDGTIFQGLYSGDERFGPGVQSYRGGRQDVGFWVRERLIRLCVPFSQGFRLSDHPYLKFQADPSDQLVIHSTFLKNRMDVLDSVLHPPEPFNYPPRVDILPRINKEVFHDRDLDIRSVAADVATFDAVFFEEAIRSRNERKVMRQSARSSTKVNKVRLTRSEGQDLVDQPLSRKSDLDRPNSRRPESTRSSVHFSEVILTDDYDDDDDDDDDDEEATVAWNKTPLFVKIQKNMIRHREGEKHVTFSVQSLVRGDRTGFGEPGPIEVDSLKFLSAASEGRVYDLDTLLLMDKVNVNVTDSLGHSALLGAAVKWHVDCLNLLLDNGADIDELTDEGVSALTATMMHLYPPSSFLYNIAETYLKEPPDQRKEAGYNIAVAVKSSQLKEKKKKPAKYDHALASSMEGSNNKRLGAVSKTVKISDVNITYNNPGDAERMRDEVNSNTPSYLPNSEEFDSAKTMFSLSPTVNKEAIDRAASSLSQHITITNTDNDAQLNIIERQAKDIQLHALMQKVVNLLLHRGSDPNSSKTPMAAIFFTVKAGDIEMTKMLLTRGANTETRLSEAAGSLVPLHISSALPGQAGVQITRLLLNSLANPDARAKEDDTFLNQKLLEMLQSESAEDDSPNQTSSNHSSSSSIKKKKSRPCFSCTFLQPCHKESCKCNEENQLDEEDWSKDVVSEGQNDLLGGRSALQIACARDDSYLEAAQIVAELLQHRADPYLICNGHTALALAIASGNDKAVQCLLGAGVDPNQALTHGVGNALSIASTTEYEHRRSPEQRIQLVDRLITFGADILAPVAVGSKRQVGTVVDYAHYMFNQDKRIAHMPYHALTYIERETYNARKALLQHLADRLRETAVARERERRRQERERGQESRIPSAHFLYTGAGRTSEDEVIKTSSKVQETRRPLLKYCYECGRMVGVRLEACTRCKEVFYCSKTCKVKAWNSRHKDECLRVTSSKKLVGTESNKSKVVNSEVDLEGKKSLEQKMKFRRRMTRSSQQTVLVTRGSTHYRLITSQPVIQYSEQIYDMHTSSLLPSNRPRPDLTMASLAARATARTQERRDALIQGVYNKLDKWAPDRQVSASRHRQLTVESLSELVRSSKKLGSRLRQARSRQR